MQIDANCIIFWKLLFDISRWNDGYDTSSVEKLNGSNADASWRNVVLYRANWQYIYLYVYTRGCIPLSLSLSARFVARGCAYLSCIFASPWSWCVQLEPSWTTSITTGFCKSSDKSTDSKRWVVKIWGEKSSAIFLCNWPLTRYSLISNSQSRALPPLKTSVRVIFNAPDWPVLNHQ